MSAAPPLFVTELLSESRSTPSLDPPIIVPWLVTVANEPKTSTPMSVPEISAAVPLFVRTLPGLVSASLRSTPYFPSRVPRLVMFQD